MTWSDSNHPKSTYFTLWAFFHIFEMAGAKVTTPYAFVRVA